MVPPTKGLYGKYRINCGLTRVQPLTNQQVQHIVTIQVAQDIIESNIIGGFHDTL
jgi:hypothetical protein